MKVAVAAETREGPLVIERGFFRHAAPGEKRPVWINRLARKYEEANQWILRRVGAVSISFDPFEFLNLADSKKRQWIIAHSPESRTLNKKGLSLFLLAGMVESRLGSGIVRAFLNSQGLASPDELLELGNTANLDKLEARLADIFHRQDPEFCHRVQDILGSVFELWSAALPAEGNISVMLGHLKAETLKLKKCVREQRAALTGMTSSGESGAVSEEEIASCREQIRQLACTMEQIGRQVDKKRMQIAEQRKKQERIHFLEENIARLARLKDGEMIEALREMLDTLQKKRVDSGEPPQELKKVQEEWNRRSLRLKELETGLEHLVFDLELKQEKRDALSGKHAACPVAGEIRCDTDMQPYRAALSTDIESLALAQSRVRQSIETEREKVGHLQQEMQTLEARLRRQVDLNRKVQQEIDLLQEQIQTEEKNRANAHGRLKAWQEELDTLRNCLPRVVPDENELQAGEKERALLAGRIAEKEPVLNDLLRRQGKAQALAELSDKRRQWQQELEVSEQMYALLGPEGIQGTMAARIARALEGEVNDILKLIGNEYDFALDLHGHRFEMGWNREGKIIPLQTINSAHFIIFIVPFLAALVRRMACIREKAGLPTLKALCIEAESLTPANLSALLKGLAVMKQKGFIDNVLVAHYHSVRDPEQLFGFREHILEEDGALTLEGR